MTEGLPEEVSSRDSVQRAPPSEALPVKPALRWLQDLEEIDIDTRDHPSATLFGLGSAEDIGPGSPNFGAASQFQSSEVFESGRFKTLMSPQMQMSGVSSGKFTFGPREATHSQRDDEDEDLEQSVTLREAAELSSFQRRSPIPPLRLDLLLPNSTPLKPLTYIQAAEALLSLDLSKYTERQRTGGCWKGLLRCCTSSQEVSTEVKGKMQGLVALSKRKLGSLEVERQLLFSIWQACKLPPPYLPVSGQWKHIGFRTSDPRSESSLVLLQLLFLATEQPALFTSLQETALKSGYQFHLLVETATAVDMALRGLKQGVLAELVREKDDALVVFNEYFLTCLSAWFADHCRWPGRVDRKALEQRCRRNPIGVQQRQTVH